MMSRQLDAYARKTLQKAKGIYQTVYQASVTRQELFADNPHTNGKHAFPSELRLSGKQIKKRLVDSIVCIQRACRQLLREKAREKHHEDCRIASALGGPVGHLYLGHLAGPGSLATDIMGVLNSEGAYSAESAAVLFERRWKLLRAFFLLKKARFYNPHRNNKRH